MWKRNIFFISSMKILMQKKFHYPYFCLPVNSDTDSLCFLFYFIYKFFFLLHRQNLIDCRTRIRIDDNERNS